MRVYHFIHFKIISYYKRYIFLELITSSKNKLVFTAGFFVWRKMSKFRCRSPPSSINLKKLIDWRKKWKDLKDEKVRTILIL